MHFKTLLLAIAGTLTLNAAFAQDKLFKKNGDMIEVKVTEITARTVSYKKADNTSGPTYTINKADVSKIEYENGSEDFFAPAENNRPARKKVNYGNNIISVMPMQIMTYDVGVGIAYERVLDNAGILSFYLPIMMEFDGTNGRNAAIHPTGKTYPAYYIMPGLKLYPTGSKGVIRYGVGPNLAYRTGREFDFKYDNMGNIVGIGEQSRNMLGIMVTNSLNINPTKHIHMGLELGLGFSYFNKLGGVEMGTEALAQFGFKIGYRF
ncbi:MAG TPA: hypothetical protein VIN07_06050 [Flavipsychrobacter sp.]